MKSNLVKCALVSLLMVLCVTAPLYVVAQTKTNTVIATVRGEPILGDEFQTRLKFEHFLITQQLNQIITTYVQFGYTTEQVVQQLQSIDPYKTWIGELTIPDMFAIRLLNSMIDERLIRQEAKRLTLSTNKADIDRTEQQFFGIAGGLNKLSEAEKTNYENTVKQFFDNLQQETGLQEVDSRPYFEATALRNVIQETITKDVSSKVLYVHLRHILVSKETEAKELIKQLTDGASFASFAKGHSIDEVSAENGGEIDWTFVDNFEPVFAAAVRTAAIGKTIGPIKTKLGYEIIQVMEREERIGTETEIAALKSAAFNNWLDALRTSAKSDIRIEETWIDYIPNLPAYMPPVSAAPATPTAIVPTYVPSTPVAVDLDSITFDETYVHPSKKFSVAVPSGWLVGREYNESDSLEIIFNNGEAFSVVQITLYSEPNITSFADVTDLFSQTELKRSWSNYASYKEIERHREADKLIINFEVASDYGQPYKARQISWLDTQWLISIRVVVPFAQPKLLDFLAEHLTSSLKLNLK